MSTMRRARRAMKGMWVVCEGVPRAGAVLVEDEDEAAIALKIRERVGV